ncbi:MAG: cysteine desulfurase / L-selenocysteine selenide-lyase (L-alanine-forming) [Cytophagaceae bacterium]|jgi:cysteine desulfurase/selenocysteine lyase|nr:cysteine desulfurase / L-selenocysteine selenide-lyase (L-alanine-forming) [Cytophagaceae bacterium]
MGTTIQTLEHNLDIAEIRRQFPVLNQQVNDKPLVYLDNAATTQKPLAVIDALKNYYQKDNANIHRGIHTLAERATADFEKTRDAVKTFIGAEYREEIIFTKGTTEGINLVAQTWGRANLKEGDEILLSAMEHHSNMVPWQMIAHEKKALIKIIPINDAGELLMDEYEQLLNSRTKLVAVVHASNALGTINPIKQIVQLAHRHGAVVLIDGAQSTSHLDIAVSDWSADFFVFSGHKVYGPTGVGVLYGKRALLEAMPPYQGGGEMIGEVRYDGFTWNELPYKFEAGTPNIADVIALKAALDFIDVLGKQNIRSYENSLLQYAYSKLEHLEGLRFIGTAKEKVSIQSFVFNDIHHQDLGIILDKEGIAIRTGHHCTQPLMGRLAITGTSRASFAVYNTIEEIDRLEAGLKKAIKLFR